MPFNDNGYDTLLPPGTYRARAKATSCGHTNGGTPFVRVLFALVDPQYPGGEIEWKGWLSEKALPHTIKNLLALGYEDSTVDPLADNAPELVPAEVDISLDHEEFKGQTYEKVKWINKAGGKATAGKLGLDLRAAFAAARKEAGVNGKPVQPRQPEPAQVAEEDVPF